MKKKNLFLGKLLLTAFILTLFGCNEDLYDDNIQNKNTLVKHITINEIDKKFSSKINERVALLKGGKKNSQGKFEYDNALGVYIDLEEGVLIESAGKYYFTFPMFKETEEHLENILFVVGDSEEMETYLVKYNITPEDFKELPAGEITSLNPEYEKIYYSGGGEGEPLCVTIPFFQTISAACDHEHSNGYSCNSQTITIFSTFCSSASGGGSDLGGSDGGSSGGTGGTGGTGGSGSGAYGGGGSGGVYTSPSGLTAEQIAIKNFIKTLTAAQKIWYNEHPELHNTLNSYIGNITQNGTDGSQFVTSFIQTSIDTGLDFDITLSEKSPTFIDFSSVSGNTPQEIKFRQVYNNVTTSAEFRNLFVSLFGNSPLFGAKFTIVDIPQTGGGHIDGRCRMFTNPSTNVPYMVIEIDRNFLLTKSKSAIALTIIHECIHAYLGVKLLNPNVGMTMNAINDMDLQDCINTYYNNFAGNQNQHSFFVDNMIPTIVEILQDIKHLIFTPAEMNEVENPTNGAAMLYSPMNTTPLSISSNQIPWNWNDFFYYFAFTGLQNCSAYPFLAFPNLNTHGDYYNFHYLLIYNAILNP